MADQRFVRGVTVANFIPGFALCVASGAISNQPVPAVGVVPMFFSAALGITVLVALRGKQHQQQPKWKPSPRVRSSHPSEDDDEAGIGAGSDYGADDEVPYGLTHPIMVFFADVILSMALIIVLVFTWMHLHRRWYYHWADDIVLATYATVPLLLSFSIHVYLAVREFVVGTGLAGFLYGLFRRPALLSDCPHCGNHLDLDDSAPALLAPTWFRGSGGSGRIKLPASATSTTPATAYVQRGWRAPPWLGQKGRTTVTAAQGAQASSGGERYRDGAEYDENAAAVDEGGKGKGPLVEVRDE